MKSEELKPCPFCGGNELSLIHNSEFDCWFILCDKCQGSISKNDGFLQSVAYDELEVDIDEIEENAMDYFLEGKIKGLEPLIKSWNTRHGESDAKG